MEARFQSSPLNKSLSRKNPMKEVEKIRRLNNSIGSRKSKIKLVPWSNLRPSMW